MKIGVLTPELPPKVGGVGTSVVRVCNSLRELGHQVHMLSPLKEGSGEVLPRIVELDLPQLSFPCIRVGGMAASGVKAKDKGRLRRVFIETAVDYLQDKDLDVFLTFTVGEYSFLGSCIAGRLGIPHVSSARGEDIGAVLFTPEGLHFATHSLERSYAMTFVCSYLKDVAETVFGQNEKFRVILNSCPPPPVAISENNERQRRSVREMLGIAQDDFVFGYCGTFREKKGCRFLGQAFQVAAERDPSVKLLIVGGARTAQEQKLAPHLFHGGLARNNVRFAGMASDRNFVYAQYCAMDVLVKPSIEDGLPNVILEAMTMGVPVIGTDVFRDVVHDRKTGFVCPRYDVESLANLMLELKHNPGMASEVAANARNLVQDRHETQREAQTFVELFEAALGKRKTVLV